MVLIGRDSLVARRYVVGSLTHDTQYTFSETIDFIGRIHFQFKYSPKMARMTKTLQCFLRFNTYLRTMRRPFLRLDQEAELYEDVNPDLE
jgi:hypothetical protein